MSDAILDYFFKVSLSVAPSMANAGYLHRALAIVKAKNQSVANTIIFATNETELKAVTQDTSAVAYFNASGQGLDVLPVLDLADAQSVVSGWSDGYTVLIGDTFAENSIATFAVGDFDGVIAANFPTQSVARTFAALHNHCAYNGDIRNMFYAFGKLLSDATWRNQQALELPYTDGVSSAADAETKFNDRVSFGLTSDQYGTRLAFLCAGGQAITAPYVIEEVKIKLQSEWVRYAAVNNPAYTITGAKLLQQDLQTRVLDPYVNDGIIDYANVTVDLADDDFVAGGKVNMQRPRAWWRIKATIQAE